MNRKIGTEDHVNLDATNIMINIARKLMIRPGQISLLRTFGRRNLSKGCEGLREVDKAPYLQGPSRPGSMPNLPRS